ncbi:MAG: 50S ribosomal protein L13 [Spirochaetia bacterium]|nr:50S ribosomal protein L13 [Spirochaetia bacterium]
MNPLYSQKTYYPDKKSLKNDWILVNAEEQVLGRLVSKVASRLMGKCSPQYQPGALVGDCVVVVNASKLKITGDKMEQKSYYRYSGTPGGLKEEKMKTLFQRAPEQVFLRALKGMLPKTRYGRKLLRRVRVHAEANHKLDAQKPVEVAINEL